MRIKDLMFVYSWVRNRLCDCKFVTNFKRRMIESRRTAFSGEEQNHLAYHKIA